MIQIYKPGQFDSAKQVLDPAGICDLLGDKMVTAFREIKHYAQFDFIVDTKIDGHYVVLLTSGASSGDVEMVRSTLRDLRKATNKQLAPHLFK